MHPLFHHLFVDYCAYFNGNQDYFECHEVLEEYWKEIAPGEKAHPLVGYIQVATGLYHWRRGNLRGATRMLANGERILNNAQTSHKQFVELIDATRFLEDVRAAIEGIRNGHAFSSFTITILDVALLEQVKDRMLHLNPIRYEFLVDKHKLRDRSGVIAERLAKLQSKNI